MNEHAPRLRISWARSARVELRAIERAAAIEILHCIDRFSLARAGDVKKLQPPLDGYRLRCGAYRVLFRFLPEDAIEITGVRHRQDAYRT